MAGYFTFVGIRNYFLKPLEFFIRAQHNIS